MKNHCGTPKYCVLMNFMGSIYLQCIDVIPMSSLFRLLSAFHLLCIVASCLFYSQLLCTIHVSCFMYCVAALWNILEQTKGIGCSILMELNMIAKVVGVLSSEHTKATFPFINFIGHLQLYLFLQVCRCTVFGFQAQTHELGLMGAIIPILWDAKFIILHIYFGVCCTTRCATPYI